MRHFNLTFAWTFEEKLPPGPNGEPPSTRTIQEDRTAIGFSDLFRWRELATLMDHWAAQIAPVVTRLLYQSFEKLAAEAGGSMRGPQQEPWEQSGKKDLEVLKAPEDSQAKAPSAGAAEADPADEIRVVRITKADVPMPQSVTATHVVQTCEESQKPELEKSHA
jgi:hypothetical protein